MSRALTVKRRMLSWFGHVIRHEVLLKTILQGTVEHCRCIGRRRESQKDNINELTGQSLSSLVFIADDRGRWAQQRRVLEYLNGNLVTVVNDSPKKITLPDLTSSMPKSVQIPEKEHLIYLIQYINLIHF